MIIYKKLIMKQRYFKENLDSHKILSVRDIICIKLRAWYRIKHSMMYVDDLFLN